MKYTEIDQLSDDKDNIYIIGTPDNADLGDHCNAIAEIEYIRKILPGSDICEITFHQCLEEQEMLIKKIKDTDVLFFHGGRDLWNLYIEHENLWDMLFRAFPRNQKIIFPQNVFFTEDEFGETALEKVRDLFTGENVLLLCRDSLSYESAQREFDCRTILIPDMTMYHPDIHYKRAPRQDGILLVLNQQEENLMNTVQSMNLSYRVPTVLPESIKADKREVYLNHMFSDISSARLVISDSLWAMIFSAIIGTPCIFIDDSRHKSHGCSQWLKNLKYLRQVSSQDHINENIIHELLEHTKNVYPEYQMRRYFNPLTEYIKTHVSPEASGMKYVEEMKKLLSHKREDSCLTCVVENRMKKSPLVSVIIPVYNASVYLEECIDSVLGQTMKDFEIICINDGSTDSSLELLKTIATQDPRVSVYTQKNAGPSRSRNAGIRHARGKYLLYLDSDDCIRENTLEKTVSSIEKDHLDLLFFSGISFSEENDRSNGDFDVFKSFYEKSDDYPGFYKGPDLLVRFLKNEEYRTTPVMQMISSEFFFKKGLWFEPGILHEDNLYTYRSILSADRVSCIPDKLYRRRVHSNSIMTNAVSFKNVYGYYVCSVKMIHFYHSIRDNLTEEQADAAKEIIRRVIDNTKNTYHRLSLKEKNFYLGMDMEDMLSFEQQIKRYDDLNTRLYETFSEKSEINAKLQTTYKEKSEINAKLQTAYKEKSEINAKLQTAYKEKSELNVKLQSTYNNITDLKDKLEVVQKKKSRLKAKLKTVTQEKDDRDLKMKELEAQLDEINSRRLVKISNWLHRHS